MLSFPPMLPVINAVAFCPSSVPRTLSNSDDVQDRETEKGRLEEAFEKCDRDLDEQIVQHYAELTTAIRTYQSITERITSSRYKIKQVQLGLYIVSRMHIHWYIINKCCLWCLVIFCKDVFRYTFTYIIY